MNSLKTAGGYLLVLQSFDDKEDDGSNDRIEDSVVRLLKLASQKGDWELCGELARFLIALDASGKMLRRAVVNAGLRKGDLTGLNGTEPATQKLRGLALALPMSATTSSLSPPPTAYRWRGGSDASSASASPGSASPSMGDTDGDDEARPEDGSSGGEDFTSLSPRSS